jgi:fucose permease
LFEGVDATVLSVVFAVLRVFLMEKAVAWLRERKGKVCIYYCYCFLLFGLVIASIGPAINDMVAEVDYKPYVLLTRSFFYILGALLSAFVCEKHPMRGNVLLSIALFMCMLSTFLVPWVSDFVLVLFCVGFQGFFGGVVLVVGDVLMIREFDEKSESQSYVQAMHACFAIGAAISPLFVSLLYLDQMKFAISFMIYGALLVPGFGFSIYFALLKDREISGSNSPHKMISQRKTILAIVVFSLVLMLYVGSEIAYGTFVYWAAKELTPPASDVVSGLISTLFWSSFAVGRILSFFFSSMFRLKPILMIIVSFGGAILFSLCGLIPNKVVLFISSIGTGLSMASIYPSVFNLASLHFEVSSRVAVCFVVSGGIGDMLIPFLVVWIAAKEGYSWLFVIVSVALSVACVGMIASTFVLKAKEKSDITDELMQDNVNDDEL